MHVFIKTEPVLQKDFMFLKAPYENIYLTALHNFCRKLNTTIIFIITCVNIRRAYFPGLLAIYLALTMIQMAHAASLEGTHDIIRGQRGLETWCRTQECIQEMLKWELQMSTQNIGNIFGKFGGRK